jgi:hypothetical protein
MRDLPYVKFMDEAHLLPDLSDIEPRPLTEPRYFESVVSRHFATYRRTMLRTGIHWDAKADNHTHTLAINGLETSANVANLKSLLLDVSILERVGDTQLELVTNGVTDKAFTTPGPLSQARLTEMLLIKRVPNYLNVQGPYHPILEEAREHRFLIDYRKWVAEQPLNPSEKELKDVKKSVEAALQQSQKSLFLKYLDRKNAYYAIAKTLGGLVVDAITGGSVSAAYDLEKERQEELRRGALRYQGFILDNRA